MHYRKVLIIAIQYRHLGSGSREEFFGETSLKEVSLRSNANISGYIIIC